MLSVAKGEQKPMPYISKTPNLPTTQSSSRPSTLQSITLNMLRCTVIRKHVETFDGYLGIEGARNTDGTGVAAVYWKDLESIRAWARDPQHQVAKTKGREVWYSNYMIRICKVEREYGRPEW